MTSSGTLQRLSLQPTHPLDHMSQLHARKRDIPQGSLDQWPSVATRWNDAKEQLGIAVSV